MRCLALLTLSILTCGGLAMSAPEAGAAGEKTILAPGRWPADLAGWERRGEAEFALDPAVTREGQPAARIRLAPGTKLAWQQLAWTTHEDLAPADEFRVKAWVRTEGIADTAMGAYLALEFIDAGGARVGVCHNKVSPANGRAGWEELTVEGRAPAGTAGLRLSLVMQAEGSSWWSAPQVVRTARLQPWPDLGATVREVTVHPDQVVLARFAGVGYHSFHHTFDFTQEQLDTVVFKRWRELNPSFSRLNDNYDYDEARWASVVRHLKVMQETGTELYLATWNPRVTPPGDERRAYARRVVDNLERLVRREGLTNLKWYCMSNELSLGGWGKMAQDLPTFRDYHHCLYDELKARGLPVGLLATDASPFSYWHTLQWAADNMDDTTAVYGGHHYVAEYDPTEERFYPWFAQKVAEGTNLAHSKGKDFILGEFGAKQDGRTIDGVKRDVCIWWDTEKEPWVTLQLAEAALAAINAGTYAMGYWTFMDFPDTYTTGYINKWGLFKWSGTDFSCRAPYFGYGLLSKFLRGPAQVVRVETGDPRLRAAAMRNAATGAWSLALVNRNTARTPLRLHCAGLEGSLRKYVYEVAHVPQSPFGDLPGPVATLPVRNGALSDEVPPNSLTVYTSALDETPPPAVTGLAAKRQEDGGVQVSWQACPAADLCYYRVFRGAEQVGSTVATSFTDRAAPAGELPAYRVVAVDQAGNAGRGD